MWDGNNLATEGYVDAAISNISIPAAYISSVSGPLSVDNAGNLITQTVTITGSRIELTDGSYIAYKGLPLLTQNSLGSTVTNIPGTLTGLTSSGNITATGKITAGGNLQVTGLTTLTGAATAPTAVLGTANNQVATTAFVQQLANSGSTLTTSITGNAGTVTNGVVTTGSYSDPSWIVSLAAKFPASISRDKGFSIWL
mgnify:CR=1 FL=1